MAKADTGRPGRRRSVSIPGAPAAPPAGRAPPVPPTPLPEALSAWNDVLDRFSDRSTPGGPQQILSIMPEENMPPHFANHSSAFRVQVRSPYPIRASSCPRVGPSLPPIAREAD